MIGISKNKKENRFGDINFLKNKVISFREKKEKAIGSIMVITYFLKKILTL